MWTHTLKVNSTADDRIVKSLIYSFITLSLFLAPTLSNAEKRSVARKVSKRYIYTTPKVHFKKGKKLSLYRKSKRSHKRKYKKTAIVRFVKNSSKYSIFKIVSGSARKGDLLRVHRKAKSPKISFEQTRELSTGIDYYDTETKGGAAGVLHSLSARYSAKLKRGSLSGYFQGYALTDSSKSRDLAYIEEFYFEVDRGNIIYKAGNQIHNWSSTDFFHPSDIINSVNRFDFAGDAMKIGEPTVSATNLLESSSFSLYLFPATVSPIFPNSDDPRCMIPKPFTLGSHIWIDKSGNEIKGGFHPQWAFKADFSFENSDLSLQYVDHIDRQHPQYYLPTPTTISPIFMASEQIGATYQYVNDQLTYKLEIFHKKFVLPEANIYGTLDAPAYMPIAVGIEQLLPSSSSRQIRIFSEYQKYIGPNKDSLNTLGLFQNDLLFGVQIDFNNFTSDQLRALYIFDIDDPNQKIIIFSYQRKLTEFIKVSTHTYLYQMYNLFTRNSETSSTAGLSLELMF